MSFTTSIIFVLSTIPVFVTSSCYSRNGTIITDIAYQPCSSSGESACCGTNHDGAGHVNVANDVCETNGLCQNYEAFDGTNEGVKLWWRQGCTDPTWSSPNCLANVCDTAEYEDDNAPVYSCGNDNWACGKKSYCSTSSRVFTLAATVGKEVAASTSPTVAMSATSAATRTAENASGVTATASASGGSTSASSVTATPASTTSAPPLSTPVSSPALLSTAAKAGIGAGIAILALLFAIILFLLQKIKKNKKAQQAYAKAELPGQSVPAAGNPEMVVYAREASNYPLEMPGNEARAHEMNGNKERMELETSEIGQVRERAELAASASVSGSRRNG